MANHLEHTHLEIGMVLRLAYIRRDREGYAR
jgi:hypothetical protein